jgi:hypothetical protein
MFYYKSDFFSDCMTLIEEPVLEIVFWYNNIKLKYEKIGMEIYNTNILIRAFTDIAYILVDLVGTILHAVYIRSTHLYVEPSGNWVSLIAIHDQVENFIPFSKYHFVEKYVYPSEEEYKTPESRMEVFFSHAKNTIEYDENVHEILITLKEAKDYFVRTCISSTAEYNPVVLPPEKSEVELLCVEYRHPDMARPVAIAIPSSYFYVGNELLSMAFVRRMLEYSSVFTTFVFDENYTVNIIDQTINQYQLTSRNYIVLEKETFRIAEIPDDIWKKRVDSHDESDSETESESESEPGSELEEDHHDSEEDHHDSEEDHHDSEEDATTPDTPLDNPSQSDASDKDAEWEMSTNLSESEE